MTRFDERDGAAIAAQSVERGVESNESNESATNTDDTENTENTESTESSACLEPLETDSAMKRARQEGRTDG